MSISFSVLFFSNYYSIFKRDLIYIIIRKFVLCKVCVNIVTGLEINNKYYTFFPAENNEHIIIFETSLNEKTNELKTSIVGITSKLIFKEITNKLNI